MPILHIEDKLEEGQVWIVQHEGSDRVIYRWLTLIGPAPDGEEPSEWGWWRSKLKFGDYSKYDEEGLVKNMRYMRNVPTPSNCWTSKLFRKGKLKLTYEYMLEKLP